MISFLCSSDSLQTARRVRSPDSDLTGETGIKPEFRLHPYLPPSPHTPLDKTESMALQNPSYSTKHRINTQRIPSSFQVSHISTSEDLK
uniref:AC4 protein n=1 Tax=Steinernema glaseri TaxID=37863 RepID=A0A1I7ZM85_9BILA